MLGTEFHAEFRVLGAATGNRDSGRGRLRRVCLFFFQAEDGIRDDLVTGVQTCALPILWSLADAGRSRSYQFNLPLQERPTSWVDRSPTPLGKPVVCIGNKLFFDLANRDRKSVV